MDVEITLVVDGQRHTLQVDTRTTLLDALRERLGNPMGSKGIGEIGIVGASPAIANATYHAAGIRIRDLPITADKLLR